MGVHQVYHQLQTRVGFDLLTAQVVYYHEDLIDAIHYHGDQMKEIVRYQDQCLY
jgi:hypothetical protein